MDCCHPLKSEVGVVFHVSVLQRTKEPKQTPSSGVCASAPLMGITQTPHENHLLSSLHELLHCRAQCDPKAKTYFCGSFLRKGVSLGCIRKNQPRKGLKSLGCFSNSPVSSGGLMGTERKHGVSAARLIIAHKVFVCLEPPSEIPSPKG